MSDFRGRKRGRGAYGRGHYRNNQGNVYSNNGRNNFQQFNPNMPTSSNYRPRWQNHRERGGGNSTGYVWRSPPHHPQSSSKNSAPHLRGLMLPNRPPPLLQHGFLIPFNPPPFRNRPPSPPPGSEEHRQRAIAEASARIKEQLNLDTTGSVPLQTQVYSDYRNDSRSESAKNKKPLLKTPEQARKKKKPVRKSNVDFQQLRNKIVKEISTMSKGKIQSLINNPGFTKYDAALQHLLRDAKLNASSELRTMYNSRTHNDDSFINSVVPDLGVELASLPDTLVDELSNLLQINLSDVTESTSQNDDLDNALIEPEQLFKQAELMLTNSNFNDVENPFDSFNLIEDNVFPKLESQQPYLSVSTTFDDVRLPVVNEAATEPENSIVMGNATFVNNCPNDIFSETNTEDNSLLPDPNLIEQCGQEELNYFFDNTAMQFPEQFNSGFLVDENIDFSEDQHVENLSSSNTVNFNFVRRFEDSQVVSTASECGQESVLQTVSGPVMEEEMVSGLVGAQVPNIGLETVMKSVLEPFIIKEPVSKPVVLPELVLESETIPRVDLMTISEPKMHSEPISGQQKPKQSKLETVLSIDFTDNFPSIVMNAIPDPVPAPNVVEKFSKPVWESQKNVSQKEIGFKPVLKEKLIKNKRVFHRKPFEEPDTLKFIGPMLEADTELVSQFGPKTFAETMTKHEETVLISVLEPKKPTPEPDKELLMDGTSNPNENKPSFFKPGTKITFKVGKEKFIPNPIVLETFSDSNEIKIKPSKPAKPADVLRNLDESNNETVILQDTSLLQQIDSLANETIINEVNLKTIYSIDLTSVLENSERYDSPKTEDYNSDSLSEISDDVPKDESERKRYEHKRSRSREREHRRHRSKEKRRKKRRRRNRSQEWSKESDKYKNEERNNAKDSETDRRYRDMEERVWITTNDNWMTKKKHKYQKHENHLKDREYNKREYYLAQQLRKRSSRSHSPKFRSRSNSSESDGSDKNPIIISIVDNELPKHTVPLEERMKVFKETVKDKDPVKENVKQTIKKEQVERRTTWNASPPKDIKLDQLQEKIKNLVDIGSKNPTRSFNPENPNNCRTEVLSSHSFETSLERDSLFNISSVQTNPNSSRTEVLPHTFDNTLERDNLLFNISSVKTNIYEKTNEFFRQELMNFNIPQIETNKKVDTIESPPKPKELPSKSNVKQKKTAELNDESKAVEKTKPTTIDTSPLDQIFMKISKENKLTSPHKFGEKSTQNKKLVISPESLGIESLDMPSVSDNMNCDRLNTLSVLNCKSSVQNPNKELVNIDTLKLSESFVQKLDKELVILDATVKLSENTVQNVDKEPVNLDATESFVQNLDKEPVKMDATESFVQIVDKEPVNLDTTYKLTESFIEDVDKEPVNLDDTIKLSEIFVQNVDKEPVNLDITINIPENIVQNVDNEPVNLDTTIKLSENETIVNKNEVLTEENMEITSINIEKIDINLENNGKTGSIENKALMCENDEKFQKELKIVDKKPEPKKNDPKPDKIEEKKTNVEDTKPKEDSNKKNDSELKRKSKDLDTKKSEKTKDKVSSIKDKTSIKKSSSSSSIKSLNEKTNDDKTDETKVEKDVRKIKESEKKRSSSEREKKSETKKSETSEKQKTNESTKSTKSVSKKSESDIKKSESDVKKPESDNKKSENDVKKSENDHKKSENDHKKSENEHKRSSSISKKLKNIDVSEKDLETHTENKKSSDIDKKSTVEKSKTENKNPESKKSENTKKSDTKKIIELQKEHKRSGSVEKKHSQHETDKKHTDTKNNKLQNEVKKSVENPKKTDNKTDNSKKNESQKSTEKKNSQNDDIKPDNKSITTTNVNKTETIVNKTEDSKKVECNKSELKKSDVENSEKKIEEKQENKTVKKGIKLKKPDMKKEKNDAKKTYDEKVKSDTKNKEKNNETKVKEKEKPGYEADVKLPSNEKGKTKNKELEKVGFEQEVKTVSKVEAKNKEKEIDSKNKTKDDHKPISSVDNNKSEQKTTKEHTKPVIETIKTKEHVNLIIEENKEKETKETMKETLKSDTPENSKLSEEHNSNVTMPKETEKEPSKMKLKTKTVEDINKELEQAPEKSTEQVMKKSEGLVPKKSEKQIDTKTKPVKKILKKTSKKTKPVITNAKQNVIVEKKTKIETTDATLLKIDENRTVDNNQNTEKNNETNLNKQNVTVVNKTIENVKVVENSEKSRDSKWNVVKESLKNVLNSAKKDITKESIQGEKPLVIVKQLEVETDIPNEIKISRNDTEDIILQKMNKLLELDTEDFASAVVSNIIRSENKMISVENKIHDELDFFSSTIEESNVPSIKNDSKTVEKKNNASSSMEVPPTIDNIKIPTVMYESAESDFYGFSQNSRKSEDSNDNIPALEKMVENESKTDEIVEKKTRVRKRKNVEETEIVGVEKKSLRSRNKSNVVEAEVPVKKLRTNSKDRVNESQVPPNKPQLNETEAQTEDAKKLSPKKTPTKAEKTRKINEKITVSTALFGKKGKEKEKKVVKPVMKPETEIIKSTTPENINLPPTPVEIPSVISLPNPFFGMMPQPIVFPMQNLPSTSTFTSSTPNRKRSKEDIMNRMMTIDIEIQKLMQEKWDLYKELQLTETAPVETLLTSDEIKSETIDLTTSEDYGDDPVQMEDSLKINDVVGGVLDHSTDVEVEKSVESEKTVEGEKSIEGEKNMVSDKSVEEMEDKVKSVEGEKIVESEKSVDEVEQKAKKRKRERKKKKPETLLESSMEENEPLANLIEEANNSLEVEIGLNEKETISLDTEIELDREKINLVIGAVPPVRKRLISESSDVSTEVGGKRRKESESEVEGSTKNNRRTRRKRENKKEKKTETKPELSTELNSSDDKPIVEPRRRTTRRLISESTDQKSDSETSDILTKKLRSRTRNNQRSPAQQSDRQSSISRPSSEVSFTEEKSHESKIVQNETQILEQNKKKSKRKTKTELTPITANPPIINPTITPPILIPNPPTNPPTNPPEVPEAKNELKRRLKTVIPCYVQLQRMVLPPKLDPQPDPIEISSQSSKTSEDECLIVSSTSDSSNIDPPNIYQNGIYCRAHTKSILDLKIIGDEFLAASEDGTIYRYCIRTGRLVSFYPGHVMAVTCLFVPKELDPGQKIFFSGSLDCCLKCYKIESCTLIQTVTVEQAIQCMDSAWGYIFLGTYEGLLFIYDIKKKRLHDNSITVASATVLMVKATTEGGRQVLILASRKREIMVRDAFSGLLLRTMCEEQKPTIYSLLLERSFVYCGTSDKGILILDFNSGHQIRSYNAGKGVVCMLTYKSLLFAGCYDGMIYIFDTRTNSHISTISGPGEGMLLSLAIVNDLIIAGTKKDHLLKIWRVPNEVLVLTRDQSQTLV